LIRDGEGQKMSKSKGNVLDPIDLIDGIELEELISKRTSGMMQPQMAVKIEKTTRKHFPDGIESYGTDSLRFTFASLATQGRFINFETGRIQGYRNFCNKLWNAARYVISNVETQSIKINEGNMKFGLAERWITSKLSDAVSATHEGIKTYRFDLASQALYEFTWDEYCDWYIELSKITLNGTEASEEEKRGTLYTLLNVLETLQRALHPFMPFITEELWHRVAALLDKKGESVMLESFPNQDELETDNSAVEQIEWIKSFIMGVRRIRAERDISPGKSLTVFVRNGNSSEHEWLDEHKGYLETLGRLESINNTDTEINDAVMALAGEMTLLVPLADFIDPKAEKIRLESTIDKLQKEKAGMEEKLNNKKFVERAPVDVVEGVKQKLADKISEIKTFETQLQSILKLIDK
jgi:valyl-tRNA synthetase